MTWLYYLRNLISSGVNTDKVIGFLATWALVSVVLLVLSAVFESQVVFGNMSVQGTVSAVLWSFVFTLIGKISPQLLARLELKVKDERYCMVVTAILLVPVIWLVKKFAVFTAVGVSNNIFVLITAIIVSLVVFYGLKYSDYYLKKIQ